MPYDKTALAKPLVGVVNYSSAREAFALDYFNRLLPNNKPFSSYGTVTN